MHDEPVHVEPYQPNWEELFRDERDRLATGLGIPIASIEHIGSTAVQGLSAKPIVDIMIGTERVPPPDAWTEVLAKLGYEALGEAGVPGRWYFRYRAIPFRNAHVVEQHGAHWVKNLAFRDYLRRSPEAAREYESAKHAAITAGATTLVAYSRAKRAVVEDLLNRALSVDETRPG